MTAVPEQRGRWAGWAVIAIAAAALAINAAWIVGHLDWLRPLEAGQPAPPLDLPRIDRRGELAPDQVHLADRRGTIVVVEFWATWCGPCLQALPAIDRAARRWGPAVEVLAVNVDDAAKARAIFDEAGWGLTLVADAGDAADRYGVQSLPHTVVIDRAGIVRLVVRGRRSGVVEDAVARLLAEPR